MPPLNTSEHSLSMSEQSLNCSQHSVHVPLDPISPPPPPLFFPGSPNGVEDFPFRKQAPRHSSFKQSSSSTTADNKGKRPKTVHFFNSVRVRDTISHRDMTDSEHYDCWFQDFEYSEIQDNNRRIVRFFERKSIVARAEQKSREEHSLSESQKDLLQTIQSEIDDQEYYNREDYCLRGLESGLRKHHQRRLILRLTSLEKVLTEQADQILTGIYDDESIAHAYSQANRNGKLRATALAFRDRKEVEEILANDKRNASTSTRRRRSSKTRTRSASTSTRRRRSSSTSTSRRRRSTKTRRKFSINFNE